MLRLERNALPQELAIEPESLDLGHVQRLGDACAVPLRQTERNWARYRSLYYAMAEHLDREMPNQEAALTLFVEQRLDGGYDFCLIAHFTDCGEEYSVVWEVELSPPELRSCLPIFRLLVPMEPWEGNRAQMGSAKGMGMG